MTMRTLGEYRFPSRSRQELYGEDQMVHVWWRDNPWMVSAVTQRVPQAMPFGAFWAEIVAPWCGTDPDFDETKGWEDFEWTLGGEPFEPDPERSLADQGVGHKDTLGMSGPAS